MLFSDRTREDDSVDNLYDSKLCCFRMEHEKMTVWTAFLRLELLYGTEDSLDNVKRRALQQMNELKVYQELVKVYLGQDQTQVRQHYHNSIL